MTIQEHGVLSQQEFEQVALLDENQDKRLELIGGEIVEVVSNNYSSHIAMLIGALITVFVGSCVKSVKTDKLRNKDR